MATKKAVKPVETATEGKAEYPKHLYHKKHGMVQVNTPEEHEELGAGYAEEPHEEE